jgi:hypothetical protein
LDTSAYTPEYPLKDVRKAGALQPASTRLKAQIELAIVLKGFVNDNIGFLKGCMRVHLWQSRTLYIWAAQNGLVLFGVLFVRPVCETPSRAFSEQS